MEIQTNGKAQNCLNQGLRQTTYSYIGAKSGKLKICYECVQGRGLKPAEMDPVVVISQLQKRLSSLVVFKNPFEVSLRVRIEFHIVGNPPEDTWQVK